MATNERVVVDYCKHSIPVWAQGEGCRMCHQKATHKIEETSGPQTFHPLTAYLCCGCFASVVTYDCSTYPYDIDGPAKPFDLDAFIEGPWEPPTGPGDDPAITRRQ